MVSRRDPADGLVRHNTVGNDYFDDSDRLGAVEAGVRLVNALRRFGVDLDGISAEKVCHNCTSIQDAYRLELGALTVAETDDMAEQLTCFAEEFERMRMLLRTPSADRPATGASPR
ncbi:hypothetical protein [Streptomyces californicus]|uniref:hypothetical protein n=1 Tax=Streptomyces californicus TaxID=67351 RepID=UPI00382DEC38